MNGREQKFLLTNSVAKLVRWLHWHSNKISVIDVKVHPDFNHTAFSSSQKPQRYSPHSSNLSVVGHNDFKILKTKNNKNVFLTSEMETLLI